MTKFIRFNSALAPSTILAVAVLLGAPLAQAQQPTPPGATDQQPNAKQQEFMQIRAKLQELQQELGKIQEQVLDNNPELKTQQEEFRDLMMSTMEDQGATPEEDINKLKTLQTELQNEEIPEDKRQQLIQDFRETNMGLQQAQQQAMQNEEVQEAQESLNDAVLTAMVEANPETEQLLSQVREARQRLMQIQQEVQGGGPPGAPGGGGPPQ